MTSPHLPQDEPTLIGKFIGAALASVFGSLTVILTPWFLACKYPIRLGLALGVLWLPTMPLFYIWVAVVAIFTFHLGFKLGGLRTLDVLNLLWNTGESYDPNVQAMAQSLRKTIIWAGIGTFVLLCLQ